MYPIKKIIIAKDPPLQKLVIARSSSAKAGGTTKQSPTLKGYVPISGRDCFAAPGCTSQ